jgi:hypothetical protein
MTFNSALRCGSVALGWIVVGTAAHAAGALGEFHNTARPVVFSARPSTGTPYSTTLSSGTAALSTALPYSVAEEVRPDGSRIRRYLTPNGQVFAIGWKTLYKPNLASLLGASFPDFERAASNAAQRGGIQRQFRMGESDLVLQSTGHLHVFSGLAYKPSLLPAGVTGQTLGGG